MTQFFGERNPDSPEMIRITKNHIFGFAPIYNENCHVIFSSFATSDVSQFSFEGFYKMFIMRYELQLLQHGACTDSIHIFDFKNVKFGHILKTSISSIRNSLHFVEDCASVHIKAIHILNASKVMKIVLGK